MKTNRSSLFSFLPQVTTQIWEGAIAIGSRWRKQKLPLYLFLALCFNLVIAPLVYAASGNEFSRSQAWSLGLLGLGTVAISIYLFTVMFAPEKF